MSKPVLNTLRRTISSTTADTWIGGLLLVAAVVYWVEANKIRMSPLDGPVGASGLPRSLAYVLAGLSLLLMIRGISETKSRLRSETNEAPAKVSFNDWLKPHLRALGMLAIGVGYLALLPWLGYALAIAALLFTVSLFNGANLNLRTILIAIIGAVFCQILFVQFLGIPLPVGELFERVFGK